MCLRYVVLCTHFFLFSVLLSLSLYQTIPGTAFRSGFADSQYFYLAPSFEGGGCQSTMTRVPIASFDTYETFDTTNTSIGGSSDLKGFIDSFTDGIFGIHSATPILH